VLTKSFRGQETKEMVKRLMPIKTPSQHLSTHWLDTNHLSKARINRRKKRLNKLKRTSKRRKNKQRWLMHSMKT